MSKPSHVPSKPARPKTARQARALERDRRNFARNVERDRR